MSVKIQLFFFSIKEKYSKDHSCRSKNNKENTCTARTRTCETYGRKEGYMNLDIRWKVYDMFRERIKETTNKSLNKKRAYKSSGLKA
jgi:hypothetical protein